MRDNSDRTQATITFIRNRFNRFNRSIVTEKKASTMYYQSISVTKRN